MLSKRISSMLLGGAAVAGLSSAAQASLTYDLRAALSSNVNNPIVDGKNVTVNQASGTITFNVFAVVVAPDNGNALDEGFVAGNGNFLSTGPTHGNLVAARGPLYLGTGGSDGTVQDLDGDGDLDVGGTNTTGAANFFNPRVGTAPTPIMGSSQLVGTVVMTLTGGLGATTVNFQVKPGNPLGTAQWIENGVSTIAGSGNPPAVFQAGSPVNLNSVPEPTTIGLIGLAGLGMLARRRK